MEGTDFLTIFEGPGFGLEKSSSSDSDSAEESFRLLRILLD